MIPDQRAVASTATPRERVDDHELLLNPDLLKLPVELTIVSGGLLGRKLGAVVDGLNGAACPIQLV